MLEKPVNQPNENDAPFRRFEDAYSGIDKYLASKGMTYAVTETKEGTQQTPLAQFIALPTEIIIRDDGAETRQEFRIEGINSQGKYLQPINVPSSRFYAMTWPLENWGFDANIMPGAACKDKLRYAISEAGRAVAVRRTIYEHLGWRKIDGRWVYLYNGGSVGADGLCVSLDGALSAYSLPEQGDSMLPTLKILDVLPKHIAIPLLGHVFLAPLREFLSIAGCTPAYTLFLAGASGSKKSTAAALALAHFGREFNAQHLPANFHDTANALRKKAFAVKDAPLVVDDFHPAGDLKERKAMDSIAQAMSRAWGDLVERSRLRPDTAFQTAQPPRSLGIMTGEDLPDIGESGLARFFLVDVKRNDIIVDKELSSLQQQAENGELAASMRSYIEWIRPRADSLPKALADDFKRYRDEARKKLAGTHDRQPPAVAWLLLGYRMMLDCAVDRGELSKERRKILFIEAIDVLTSAARAQKRDMAQTSPVKLFVNTLFELEASGEVIISEFYSLRNSAAYPVDVQGRVGYRDDRYIYLFPTASFNAVNTAMIKGGSIFPIKRYELWKRMREIGLIEPSSDGELTYNKTINGKSSRFVFIKRDRAEQILNEEPA